MHRTLECGEYYLDAMGSISIPIPLFESIKGERIDLYAKPVRATNCDKLSEVFIKEISIQIPTMSDYEAYFVSLHLLNSNLNY